MENIQVLELTPIGIQREGNPRTKVVNRYVNLVFLCKIIRRNKISYVLVEHPWWDRRTEENFIQGYAFQVISSSSIRRFSTRRLSVSELMRFLGIESTHDDEIGFINAYGYVVLEMLHEKFSQQDKNHIPLSVEKHEEDNLSKKEIESLFIKIVDFKNTHGLNKSELDLLIENLCKIDVAKRLQADEGSTGNDIIFLHFNEINVGNDLS